MKKHKNTTIEDETVKEDLLGVMKEEERVLARVVTYSPIEKNVMMTLKRRVGM